jgi:hypothetical protein
MIRQAAKWAAVLLFLATGAFCAVPAWQVPEADVRLRVLSSSHWTHLIRVDLPVSLRGDTKGVRAMLPGKRELPAQLVHFGNAPVAVEVSVPRLQSSDTADSATDVAAPVEVYLLKEEPKAGAKADLQRTPAQLHRSVRSIRSLTTRPFTPVEALRLIGAPPVSRRRSASSSKRPRTYFYWTWDAAGVGQVYNRTKWTDPGEKRIATMHWVSDLRSETPQAMAFGADQPHVAWFVYVDGKPVADWRTGVPEKSGAIMGPVVELSQGFHQLEYIVVQQEGETIPRLLWRDRGKKDATPVPAELQYSVRLPGTVLVEGKDGRSGGFRFARVEQRMRERTDQQFFDVVLDTPKVAGKALPQATLAGTVDGERRAWLPAETLPAIRVPFGDAVLEFPERHAWLAPTTFDVEARLAEGPVVLSADQPYPATVCLDTLYELPADTANRLRIRWDVLALDGKSLRSGEVPCRADREGAETSFEIPIPAHARRAELRILLDGLEVAPRQGFRLLRPGDSPVGLRVAGRSLFLGHERAILVCEPLGPLPAVPPSTRKGAPHLVILDDFWATSSGPEATVRPETVLAKALPYAVFRLSPVADRAIGAAAPLGKFGLLPSLLEQRADAALFALGWQDLQAGASGEELCRHLLFLVQAAQAHGIRPSLMALPTLPNTRAPAVREAALLVKELALHLEIPVVDAFSAERLGTFEGGPFSRYYAAAQGAVTLTTPNDTGRQRLCDLVRQVFAP